MRWLARACVSVALVSSACGPQPSFTPEASSSTPATVTLLFGGDVMPGRGEAPIVRDDPWSIFQGVRSTIEEADLAVANLESPLTRRPHAVANPNALEGDPRAAAVLAAAGFDAMSVANNHAADAGPHTVADTVSALHDAQIAAIGVRPRPVVVHRNGLAIALLAYDASPPASRSPGVAGWDPSIVRRAVRQAADAADLVTVSLHGGLDYRPLTDPVLWAFAVRLARWGADIVWCHGPHVVQPVRSIDPDHDGRATVVATSLGNLLFDEQGIPGTDVGMLLEVRADAHGVIASRVGSTVSETGRVRLRGWTPPSGDAVSFDGGWWEAIRSFVVPPVAQSTVPVPGYPASWVVLDAAEGDVNGDGAPEVVVAFRRPFSPGVQISAMPHHGWTDADGRKAAVGVYTADGLRPLWVASSVRRPVASVTPCGDVLVVAYSSLLDPAVVATGLWEWHGFGFTSSTDIPGPGTPGCVDVDGDGIRDPVVTGRGGS